MVAIADCKDIKYFALTPLTPLFSVIFFVSSFVTADDDIELRVAILEYAQGRWSNVGKDPVDTITPRVA
jgi:hypothetical protein